VVFKRQIFVLSTTLAGGLLWTSNAAVAKSHDSEAGTADLYQDIETVAVFAPASERNAQTGSITELPPSEINFLKPRSLVDIFALVPAANVRVNSRGETLVSIRGGGERQQALFLDGAPVNIPWDNRFDLRLIPAMAIGNIRVVTGPSAATFGANTSGGVVDITPDISAQNRLLFEGGQAGRWALEAKAGFNWANTRSQIAAGHFATEGVISPGGRASAFSPIDGNLITNTDRKQTSVFVRSSTGSDIAKLGVSLLYSDAAFGIAPEQGPRVDPDDARYWRFPNSEHLLLSGNFQSEITDKINVMLLGWYQKFDQQINSFEDITFSSVEDVQLDRNNSVGARVRVGYNDRHQQISLSASSAWSKHNQEEFEPADNFRSIDEFSQYTASVGGDYTRQFSNAASLSISVAYDVLDPRKTAGRGSGTKFDGLSSSLQIDWAASDQWHFRVSAGRKVRLPTMRELFGEAIGRFVINPDLEPEVSWLFEVSAGVKARHGRFDITPFWVERRQTIDQIRINVDGQSLRQRVNLAGSRVYGVEAKWDWLVNDLLSLTGNATWSKSRVKLESVAKSVHRLYLSDRPNWLAQAGAKYQVGAQTTFGLSVVYRGAAKSQDAAGVFLDLPAATQINMVLSHTVKSAQDGSGVELFAKLDNLTDTFVEPQLGLPAAGRSIILGLKTMF